MYKNSTPTTVTPSRDAYDAITHCPADVNALIDRVKQAVGWLATSESVLTGGFESLKKNIDVYGYDIADTNLPMAVVQFRRAGKNAYALVGIDDGHVFILPLTSSPRHNPKLRSMSPQAVVSRSKRDIFSDWAAAGGKHAAAGQFRFVEGNRVDSPWWINVELGD